MLVPMLSTMDTPMAAMNSTGSIHESVESTSRSRMAGTMMATAPSTSCTVFAWSCAVSIASPDTAFARPRPPAAALSALAWSTRPRRAGMAVPSSPSATVTWNSAVPAASAPAVALGASRSVPLEAGSFTR